MQFLFFLDVFEKDAPIIIQRIQKFSLISKIHPGNYIEVYIIIKFKNHCKQIFQNRFFLETFLKEKTIYQINISGLKLNYCYLLPTNKSMKTLRSRPQIHPSKAQPLSPFLFEFEECPEQNATEHLLEISNQDLEFNSFKNFCPQEKQLLRLSEIEKRKSTSARTQTRKAKLSVPTHFTECCKLSRKKASKDSNPEENQLIFKKSALNPSNFLILSNQKYSNIKVYDGTTPSRYQNPNEKPNPKTKQTKNIGSILRKRNNKSLLKHYLEFQQQISSSNSNTLKRAASPKAHQNRLQNRISQSCELSSTHPKQSESPIKIISTSPIKIEEENNCIELKYTNHNFRNKRLSYRGIKYAK